jgi:hypothetical protein
MIGKLKRVKNDPHAIYRELNWFLTTCNARYHSLRYKNNGFDVMSEDWDILILLDSCRADVFRETNWIEGEFSTRRSPASMSRTFLDRSFGDEHYHDTVYVTANPHTPVLSPDTFHKIVPLFEHGLKGPSQVSNAAIQADLDYPRKRIIVHYMQPHHPFLGKFGQSNPNGIVGWRDLIFPKEFSLSDLRRAYRENLELALEEVERLSDDMTGKIVISADHGELLGERQWPIPIRGYEHKRGLHHPRLRTVPWHEIPVSERRDIRSEPPEEELRYDEDAVQQSLEALGYV